MHCTTLAFAGAAPRSVFLPRTARGVVLGCMVSIVLCLALLSVVGPALAGQSVLVLHSYHQGYAWTDEISQGIESVFRAKALDVELHVEYMDLKRNPTQTLFPLLHELYSVKYKNQKFKVVICTDDNALDFMLVYGQMLFPGTPVVFCGINDFTPSRLRGRTEFTGVVEDFDAGATLEIMFRLHPGLEAVGVVSDGSVTGRANLAHFREAARAFRARATFVELANLSSAELIQGLKALPERSAVVFLSFFEDRLGAKYTFRQALDLIDRSCRFPVYSMWDFTIGAGAVGGKMVSGRLQGQEAARMAVRLLAGERAEHIPIQMQSPNEYMFDSLQLHRFGIAISDLPQGSVVINNSESFYDRHGSLVWSMALGFSSLFFLSAGLAFALLRLKRIKDALRKNESRYRSLYENASESIVLLDNSGLIVDANPSTLVLFGYAPEEIEGRPVAEFFHPDDLAARPLELDRILAGATVRAERRVRRCQGDYLFMDASAKRISDNLVQVISRDVTERKQLEDDLLRAKIQAENASQAKSEFLANMSHELRTPLGEIVGLADMCLHPESERQHTHLELIKTSANNLHILITDLLDLSTIESGEFELLVAAFDLRAVVESAVKPFAARAAEKGLDFQLCLDSGIPRCVLGDAGRLGHILAHLLDNALKFTPRGHVRLDVQPNGTPGLLRFEISDTGLGISEELRPRLFEHFTQADSSYTKRFQGAGLGLAICKRLVQMMGGRIAVESELGKGSVFAFTIAATESAA